MSITDEERLEIATKNGYRDLPTVRLAYEGFNLNSYTTDIEAEVEKRVREECAEVCMEIYGGIATDSNGCNQRTARHCAEAIRNGCVK